MFGYGLNEEKNEEKRINNDSWVCDMRKWMGHLWR